MSLSKLLFVYTLIVGPTLLLYGFGAMASLDAAQNVASEAFAITVVNLFNKPRGASPSSYFSDVMLGSMFLVFSVVLSVAHPFFGLNFLRETIDEVGQSLPWLSGSHDAIILASISAIISQIFLATNIGRAERNQ